MKDIVILYESCCLYEIVSTNYYLQFSGAEVVFAGLGKHPVRTKEGFSVNVDCCLEEIDFSDVRSLILPGGNKAFLGTDEVKAAIRSVYSAGKLVAAICAAPSILGRMGLLDGRKYACYPGFESLVSGGIHTGKKVEQDDIFITAEGMGVADEFGFYLIGLLFGTEKEAEIRQSVRK